MVSPEASAAYLERFRFKTLMEWLTARCILHRPDDPMVFCLDLLDRNVKARGGRSAPYDPTCAPRLLKECYDDAMDAADEHGIIRFEACRLPVAAGNKDAVADTKRSAGELTGTPDRDEPPFKPTAESKAHASGLDGVGAKGLPGVEMSPSPMASEVIRPILLSALQELCELSRPEIAAAAAVAGACKAVRARWGALFKVINKTGELREIGSGRNSEKRIVKPGQGLVGNAAIGLARDAAVIADPSKNEAFSAEVDIPLKAGEEVNETGGRVPGLVYGPIKNSAGDTWGVLVVAEPANGEPFDEESLQAFRAVSVLASVSMQNSEAFAIGEKGCDKFRSMVEVIEATNDQLGVNHLLYTIAKCLPIICDAMKCTCFLVDDDKDELWVVQGEVNMRVPKSKGIVGAVATSGKAENICNVYADPRFNKDVDVETGFQTHSILAMPVRGGGDNKVIAVVQLINKICEEPTESSCGSATGMHFTTQDEAVIGAFLSLLGPHIFASSIMKFKRKVHTKVTTIGNEEEAFPEDCTIQPRRKSMGFVQQTIVAEQPFEEEEEDKEDVDGDEGNRDHSLGFR